MSRGNFRKRGADYYQEYKGVNSDNYVSIFEFNAALSEDVHPDFKFKIHDHLYETKLHLFKNGKKNDYIFFNLDEFLDFCDFAPQIKEQMIKCDKALREKYGNKFFEEAAAKRRRRNKQKFKEENTCIIPSSAERLALQKNLTASELDAKREELEEKVKLFEEMKAKFEEGGGNK